MSDAGPGLTVRLKSELLINIFVETNLTYLKCVVYLCPVPISTLFCGRFVELSEMSVNNTFEVSRVYFHKDNNLLSLLED